MYLALKYIDLVWQFEVTTFYTANTNGNLLTETRPRQKIDGVITHYRAA